MAFEIELSKGFHAFVDDDDAAHLSKWKWCAMVTGRKQPLIYAVRTLPKSEQAVGRAKMVLMHRQILSVEGSVVVDHIDGNPLNNRRENLRAATQHLNSANNRRAVGQHGFKGVHKPRGTPKFAARIFTNGGHIHLGMFDTIEEAARAYDAAATTHFGEFAKRNFPI